MKDYIASNIIISLDFDGTIAHGVKVKRRCARKWLGIDLGTDTKKEGFNRLMKEKGLDMDYRTFMDRVNQDHIMDFEVPRNCTDVLHRLHSEGFRFVVVTSRIDSDYPGAQRFIKKNFHRLIKYIHNTSEAPKASLVHRLRARMHVDDDLHKLEDISYAWRVYYRQDENRHIKGNDVIEMNDWRQFLHLCRHLKTLHEAICWANNIRNDSRNLPIISELEKKVPDYKELIDAYKKLI